MMNPYKKILFPVTIFQNNIRENSALKSKYAPIIERMYKNKSMDIPEGWETGNVYTSFEQEDINRSIFKYDIISVYETYVRRFFDQDVEFDIVDLWFNCYENGEYQEQHSHLNTDIFNQMRTHYACIHYLKYDTSCHKPVVFVDPIQTLRYNSMEMKSNHYVDRYAPSIEEGDILMFPNYLEHLVRQSDPTPDNSRITISFNIAVNKYGKHRRK